MYGRTYEELFGDDPDKVEDEEASASEEGEPEVRFGYLQLTFRVPPTHFFPAAAVH